MNKDNSRVWKKGQVKIEFFEDTDKTLKCIYWTHNLTPKVHVVHVSDSVLQIGRNLRFYRIKPQPKRSEDTNKLVFTSLSEQTNYLKIFSFDLSLTHQIDSLINANRTALQSKKNLIIDIRNNGGGGFDAFHPLLPFVLNDPVYEQPYYGSVWASKDNFRYYDSTKYDYAETVQDSMEEQRFVDMLSTCIGTFSPVEQVKDTIVIENSSPHTVALLYNRFTASSAEGLILLAAQSPKVQTYGEHSMGAVSYGDWRPFRLPDLGIEIAMTTKKMIFKNNDYFESSGIPPHIDLSNTPESQWIEAVINQLEQ